MATAWSAPDVAEAVALVEGGIKADKYGALVRVFTPSHRRAVELHIQSIGKLQQFKDRLAPSEPESEPGD